jgi:hypothetical protein
LWWRSLEGPILLVDPGTREILTDEADSAGLLSAEGDLYGGFAAGLRNRRLAPGSRAGSWRVEHAP